MRDNNVTRMDFVDGSVVERFRNASFVVVELFFR